jgi:soluble lytic murein transglycosylase
LAEARTGASAAVPAVAKLKSEPSADKKVTAAFGVVEKLIRKNDFGRAADALDYLTHLYPEAVKERPEAVAELWVGAGDYNRALEIASEYLDKSVFDINLAHESPLTRALYPLAYLDSAKKEADKNHLPLPLILGIMREESLFLRGVRSHAGAIGVMQLMPATARIKARGLGVPFDTVNLSDPADNILLGASFLKDLMDRFNEQTPLAVMGYNAGPGNVTKWMGAQGYLPLDEFVEAIPFTETRGYVKRVLRSAHIYGHLLGRTKRSALVPSMDLQP